MSKPAIRKPRAQKARAAAEAKGLAMVTDLQELIATMKSGTPLEPRFTVRTVTMSIGPGQFGPAEVRATRERSGEGGAVVATP